MTDFTPAESLSDLLPTEELLTVPSNTEPDFDDLEALLAESVAAVKKVPTRKVITQVKNRVDAAIEQFKLIRWDVLEHVQVWTMPRCKCGHCGTLVFVRNMRKLSKCGCSKDSPQLHWETIETMPQDCHPRMALVTREVCRCEYCAELAVEKFEEFSEVVK